MGKATEHWEQEKAKKEAEAKQIAQAIGPAAVAEKPKGLFS